MLNQSVRGVQVSNDVRDYYEANTHAFIRFGEGGHAIHRAIWGPGVSDKSAAFRYVDERVRAELRDMKVTGHKARVVDLGCGVGASLTWLAQHAGIEGIGITISPTQAAWATRQAEKLGLAKEIQFLEASFVSLPRSLGEFDLAFSIEAFVHSPDPSAYLAEAARHLRPHGKLVIVDDFLTAQGANPHTRREARWVREFRDGWLARSLVTVDRLAELAELQKLRLMRDEDLTPYVELGRPRDLVIAALVNVGRHLPLRSYRWRSLVGGHALQRGLVGGVFEHRMVVFEKLP